MQIITSVHNPAVQAARDLQAKRGRDESGLFLCEGEHMVAEAARNAPRDVTAVFVEEGREERFAPLLATLSEALCYVVPASVLKAISEVKTPQGIAATARKPKPTNPASPGNRAVLLENLQDPGNVGAILRTADAAGFDACLLAPGCADPFSPKALRATMGSVFRVPVAEVEGAAETARALAGAGYAVIASVLNGEDFFRRKPLPEKVCLIIGNEGAGVTPETIEAATHRYRLPMRGGAESLNAAAAAAVFLFEIAQRG
jgi:RNA methyltransferase, TrmH family